MKDSVRQLFLMPTFHFANQGESLHGRLLKYVLIAFDFAKKNSGLMSKTRTFCRVYGTNSHPSVILP